VPAHRNCQAHQLHGQPAENKCRSPFRVGKEDQRGKSEKEPSGHHQQSGVLHSFSFDLAWHGATGTMENATHLNPARAPRNEGPIESGCYVLMNFKAFDLLLSWFWSSN
jgi:hypothetical protein